MSNKKESISLSSLKSSNRGKNIDGKELRDFGNGKMEFDPIANGIPATSDEPELRESDREAALRLFDEQLEGRKKEVEHFNNLIDKYDGVLTEEDYLRETGRSYISDMLNDKMTDEERAEVEAERAANREKKKQEELNKQQEAEKKKVMQFPTSSFDDLDDDDLDELEKEILSEEDTSMPIARGTEVTGDFDVKQFQRQQGIQPMGVSDTYVDPNLARIHETPEKEEEKVTNEYAEIENEIMNEDYTKTNHYDSYTKDHYAEKSESTKATQAVINESPSINSAVTGKVNFTAPEQKTQVVDNNGLTEEEKDLAALDDDTLSEDDENTDSYWKKIGAAYTKKVKPVMKKLDLNAAVVSSEPVTVSTIVNNSSLAAHSFTWVLPVSGRPYTMKSFTAAELNSLGTMAGNARMAKDIIKNLWDHLIDGKGDNFDQWCKVTSHKDLVHLWFGVYGACFDGSNYIPYVCDKCREATISDNIDILSMVEYKDDETKAKAEAIRNMPFEPEMGKIQPVTRIQISDNIVIDFKDPSVYDILMAGLIDATTREKYPEGTAMVPYIANIYFADTSTGSLVLRPLSNKTYPGNDAKTLKRKAIEYSMVIRSFNSEQYSMVSQYISQMSENDDDMITYVYPEYTCDHCHETIPKVETAPSEMVFTRHRLALTES